MKLKTEIVSPPPVRVISRLDVKGVNVIKGIHLEGLRKVGLPNDMAMRYYLDGADEILFMDAVASLYDRNSILPVVSEAARNIFVPLTVGGGIRSLDDIREVLRSGADKVAINTAAIKRPEFLREAAETFGSQCIALSVEAKSIGQNKWQVMTDCGREKTNRDVIEWVQEAESLSIGEVLVTSIDTEGTREGFDLPLIGAVAQAVSVSVVASGGAGSAEDVSTLFSQINADAAACASILHYETCSITEVKETLNRDGIGVRL
jgi:imidazole glycerol-phosphate synthase subunit HisF